MEKQKPDPKLLPNKSFSVFDGNFEESKKTVFEAFGIKEISHQPVSKVVITYSYKNKEENVTVIEAGEGKYFGLSFFEICRGLHHVKKHEEFEISFLMVIDAMLFYGKDLWCDNSKPHPSIEPFRKASYGKLVKVRIFYEPHH